MHEALVAYSDGGRGALYDDALFISVKISRAMV